MAYVPSHQELREHPKTKRAARRAGVSLPTMIGHLHLLWWWALDHAPDGDLSRFDADDLADGAMWEGDPEAFVKALMDCGPGGSDGFLDADGRLHDWDQYGGKYGQRVAAAKKAAAVRWQSERNAAASDDAEEIVPNTAPEQGVDATAMPTHYDRNAAGNAEERREEDKTPLRPDGRDEVEQSFEHFWQQYPARDGKKRGKGNALIEWRKLTIEQRRRAFIGARHLAQSEERAKDPERFLRRAKGGKGDFPFDDYQTAASAQPQVRAPRQDPVAAKYGPGAR